MAEESIVAEAGAGEKPMIALRFSQEEDTKSEGAFEEQPEEVVGGMGAVSAT